MKLPTRKTTKRIPRGASIVRKRRTFVYHSKIPTESAGIYLIQERLPISGERAEISVPRALRSSSDTDKALTGGELYFGIGVYIGVVWRTEVRKFFRRNNRDTIIIAIPSRHPINQSSPATTVSTDTSDTKGNDIFRNEVSFSC